jgi:hypothetical protein
MNVPSMPGTIGKFGMYIRVNCDVSRVPNTLRFRLFVPGIPEEIIIGTVDRTLLQQGKDEAIALKSPIAGYIIKGAITPLPIQQAGQIIMTAEVDGEDHPCGVLNIAVVPTLTAATATSG